MIKHIWSMLCEKSIVDSKSNNVSLIGIIEEAQFHGNLNNKQPGKDTENDPSLYLHIEWLTLWARKEKNTPIETEVKDYIINPSGEITFTKEYHIDLSKNIRLRCRRNISFAPFKQSGKPGDSGQYLFCVKVKNPESKKWEEVSQLPVDVKIFIEDSNKPKRSRATKAPLSSN